MFANMNVAPNWVLADPDLALAWAWDRSRTTVHASARCRSRISDQLFKIGLAKSKRADRALVQGRHPRPTVAARIKLSSAFARRQWQPIRCTASARGRPIRVVVTRDPYATLRRWKDHDDGSDGGNDKVDSDDDYGGVAGQGGHATMSPSGTSRSLV